MHYNFELISISFFPISEIKSPTHAHNNIISLCYKWDETYKRRLVQKGNALIRWNRENKRTTHNARLPDNNNRFLSNYTVQNHQQDAPPPPHTHAQKIVSMSNT